MGAKKELESESSHFHDGCGEGAHSNQIQYFHLGSVQEPLWLLPFSGLISSCLAIWPVIILLDDPY